MAADKETLAEKKLENKTIEKEKKAKQNSEEEKEVVEEMDEDKQDEGEEVTEDEKQKVVKKEEEVKSDDAISPKTPGSRPTRERKTVERYFESLVARGSATKPLSIEKGHGTQLKDIPNVAYKLSKTKLDDNLHTLHSLLFGKKTKAHNLKKNIGQFSGYVWVENELEKQRAKIKEKLDKCVKEKLLFFCDILNIPDSRSAAKKDELSVKLLDFLESPHSTTDSLLAETEQKSKKRKSKGKTSKSKGSSEKAAGKSATQKRKKSEGEKSKESPKIEEDETDDEPLSTRDESGDDNDDEEANEVGSDLEESGSEEEEEKPKKKKSNGNVSLKKDSESGSEEEDEEKPKKKKSNGNVSLKKDSGSKVTEKPKAVKKDIPAKSPKSWTKSTKVSSSTASKRGASGADSLVTPKKQKVEKKSQKEDKENASNKKQSTKSPAKVSEKEGKGKSLKRTKAEPSNVEIHAAVVKILKEVDFESATLSDIIRQLGSHFGVDLLHRKAEVKAIITDVINNMSDGEGDNPEAENDENDEADDPEAENDEEKNEADDPEAENNEGKNEADDSEVENNEGKNEGDA